MAHKHCLSLHNSSQSDTHITLHNHNLMQGAPATHAPGWPSSLNTSCTRRALHLFDAGLQPGMYGASNLTELYTRLGLLSPSKPALTGPSTILVSSHVLWLDR